MTNFTQAQIDEIAKHLQIVIGILKTEKTTERKQITKPFLGDFPITQKFGENPKIYTPMGYAGHFGIDYATPWGTPILACDDGEVGRVGFTSGNGNFIELKHEWGSSLYLHFKDPATAQLGEKIMRGQVIGFAGNTGSVQSSLPADAPHRGTHLHFSIKVNGMGNVGYKNFIDPTPFFLT